MNKQDLIHKIAEGAGITQKEAAAALEQTVTRVVIDILTGHVFAPVHLNGDRDEAVAIRFSGQAVRRRVQHDSDHWVQYSL